MVRRGLLALALVGFCSQAVWAGAVTEHLATVRVAGTLHKSAGGGSTFELRVAYRSEAPTLGDALLVYAEPSHTLLLAHVNRPAEQAWRLEQSEFALASILGSEKDFSHVLSLPYDPLKIGDRRITVVMRSAGQDWLLADGTVNTSHFEYETTFSVFEETDGPTIYLGGTHCCTNKRCGKICETCPGAFFTCDLINCTITCDTL